MCLLSMIWLRAAIIIEGAMESEIWAIRLFLVTPEIRRMICALRLGFASYAPAMR